MRGGNPRACDKSGPVFENCTAGQTKGQACALNVPPPFYPPDAKCPAYPVQVARMRPISNNSTDPVVATNTAAHELLTAVNPRTVFQYYELVDVLWPTSPQDNYINRPRQPGPVVPLPMSGATPDPKALPVANSSMETYVQNVTCLSCHRFAKVPGGKYASDFSFILGDAQSAAAARAALHGFMSHRRRHLPPGLVKFPH